MVLTPRTDAGLGTPFSLLKALAIPLFASRLTALASLGQFAALLVDKGRRVYFEAAFDGLKPLFVRLGSVKAIKAIAALARLSGPEALAVEH